jgi:hypothetical protein
VTSQVAPVPSVREARKNTMEDILGQRQSTGRQVMTVPERQEIQQARMGQSQLVGGNIPLISPEMMRYYDSQRGNPVELSQSVSNDAYTQLVRTSRSPSQQPKGSSHRRHAAANCPYGTPSRTKALVEDGGG